MNIGTSDSLRGYLKQHDEELSIRADNFWRISSPIIERQNSPNSNENGLIHVNMVEHNCWRLITESNNLSDFSIYELFILSCSACSHDFDKGLLSEKSSQSVHGEGSGNFLLQNYKQLQQKFPEVIAIKKIVGIHDLSNLEFQKELASVDKIFPLSKGTIKLQKLAIILKASDILHTDNSRIPELGADMTQMKTTDRNKFLARESIIGWHVDGSRIMIKAVPKNLESLAALNDCIKYIENSEWPTVSDKLSDYNFPSELSFSVDSKVCLGQKDRLELSDKKGEIVLEKDGSDLPPIVTNWVGREKELTTLNSNFKVIFITGIGGQGKSATAAHFIKDKKIIGKYKYIDWRDFKEEEHKFNNKIISMISVVSRNQIKMDDVIGLNDDDLISIFFQHLSNTKGLFILDNVDSYIDLEKFIPSKGIGRLLAAAISKIHNSKFVFTCRPFIRYAGVDFYQLALDGLSEKNTIAFFQQSNIPIKSEKIISYAKKAHKLTKGHPLWISLIIAQAQRGENILSDFLRNLESSKIADHDISSLLSETILSEIWTSLNQRQQTLLRIMAESVRAETVDDLSEIASSELNYNAFSKSLKTLNNLNLIVEKREGNFMELHPLVKEFVRIKYPRTDRSKYISLFIRFYDNIVLVLKPRLSHELSFSEFSNWTNKVELHTNAKDFQKAIDCLAEIKSPILTAGYSEELLRVSKLLFNSLSWRKDKIGRLNQFNSTFHTITKNSNRIWR